MKKYINILIAVLFLLHFSCKSDRDDDIDPATGINPELTIYFSVQVPSMRSSTRAVQEDALSSINILILENAGNGYQYIRQVEGYNVGATGEALYNFSARVPSNTNPIKLFLLGNYTDISGNVNVGDSESTIRQALTGTFTETGFDGALPMFGEIEFSGGLAGNTTANTVLVRSVARADVINNAANFTLTSVQIFRASNRYQVIPKALVNNVATTASIPNATTQTINTTQITVTDNQSIEQLYLPESPLPAENNRRNATVVVVGGQYNGSSTTTYYRIDFVPDNSPSLFGQVLRNHRYGMNIVGVEGPGWETPEEAARNSSSQFEVTIKVWDENTVSMVFDNVNYFGVSSRTINLPAPVGSTESISVDTNLDTYQLYWSDENGNILDENDVITWDESFTSPDGLYTAAISNDGTQITATANATASQTPAYLLAGAGRLRILLTIQQKVTSLNPRSLNVFGRNEEIGSLGDYVLGNTVYLGERAEGMVALMRNAANFGPQGVIPIQSINIAGNRTVPPTAVFLELFDVLYFPYPYNPDATYTTRILNWHNASDKRVLFIQYDNSSTNNYLLTTLGVTRNFSNTSTTAYTISPDAPVQFLAGPFGAVDPAMRYRCVDTTHGEITLAEAAANNISPILIGGGGGMVLGVDLDRRIVYSGDIDIYNSRNPSNTVQQLPASGEITNDASRLIANLWAWIATTVLTE